MATTEERPATDNSSPSAHRPTTDDGQDRLSPQPSVLSPDEQSVSRAAFIDSFRYAFAGLAYSFRTQRNFRIHIAIAILAALVGLVVGLSWVEWAIVAVLVIVVLSAEMMNTMVEALVDLVTQEYHPLAKVAKDVAAGVVLLSAIGSVVVGALIYLPKIVALLVK